MRRARARDRARHATWPPPDVTVELPYRIYFLDRRLESVYFLLVASFFWSGLLPSRNCGGCEE